MKSTHYTQRATLAGCSVLALAMLGNAQTPNQTGTPSQTATPRAGEGLTHRPTLAGAVVQASSLNGCDVYAANKKDVGDVKDLLVQPHTGLVEFAVVGFDDLDEAGGGVARNDATDDKLVVVPLSFLTPVWNDEGEFEHVRLSGPIEKIRSAPEFDEDRWSDMSASELDAWCQRMCAHYGVEGRMGGGAMHRLGDKARDIANDATLKDDLQDGGMQKKHGMALRKCSTLMDTNVHTQGNEDIGDIKEIAIDTAHGRMLFFVVDMGGFLGIGQKDYALPWSFANFRTNEDGDLHLSVPVTKENLKQAPEFDNDDWRGMTNPDWLNKLYAYYSVEPYWSKPIEAGYRSNDGKRDTDTSRSGSGH